MASIMFRRRVVPVARRRRGRTPPPPRTPGMRRILRVIRGSTGMRRATVRTSRRANRTIRIGCIPMRIRRRRPRRRRVFRIMRRVPRFPKNVTRYLGFLNGGVGCPAVSRRGNIRNGIVIRFIIGGSNSVISPIIIHDMSPCLSGRTLHMVGAVPG